MQYVEKYLVKMKLEKGGNGQTADIPGFQIIFPLRANLNFFCCFLYMMLLFILVKIEKM